MTCSSIYERHNGRPVVEHYHKSADRLIVTPGCPAHHSRTAGAVAADGRLNGSTPLVPNEPIELSDDEDDDVDGSSIRSSPTKLCKSSLKIKI